MNLSYSDQRQRIYFRAARELRAVACEILDDVQNPVELTGESAPWAFRLAVQTAKDANAVADKGHEQCVADARTNAPNFKSGRTYHEAINAFQARLAEARGITRVEANELCKEWVAPHPAATIGN